MPSKTEPWTDEERALIRRLKKPNEMSDEDMRTWWLGNALSSGQPTKPPKAPVILEIV